MEGQEEPWRRQVYHGERVVLSALTRSDERAVIAYLVDRIGEAAQISRSQPLDLAQVLAAAQRLACKIVQKVPNPQMRPGATLIPAHEVAALYDLILVTHGHPDIPGSERLVMTQLLHEYAHKLMLTEVAQKVFGVDSVICLGVNGRWLRHRLAEETEDELVPFMVFADPQERRRWGRIGEQEARGTIVW